MAVSVQRRKAIQEERAPRVNVGPAERWLSMLAGGALTAYGLRSRERLGGAVAVVGAALLHRGATGHCAVYQALGIDRGNGGSMAAIAGTESDTRRRLGGARGVHVERSVTVNRPIAEVFRFWRNFENLPRFMRHLKSVTVHDQGFSRWVAKGPAGSTVSWDARIINETDNKAIAWQSLAGSTIASAGSVHFDQTARGTRVRVRLQYSPPAGRLGSAVAWLFGEEPNRTIREDLQRFKMFMEAGEVPTVEGQASGRAVRHSRGGRS